MKISVIFVILLIVSIKDASSFFCNKSTTIDRAKWPDLPQIPQSFKSNLEINLLNEQSTMDAVLYFDSLGNRVALYTTKEGIDGVSVYDFPSNEVFYVTHGVCLVANITQRPEADLFGVTESDGNYHVMTSMTALKFGDMYNETYMGTDVIRGIIVDRWRSCLHWSRSNANFTVDYYFTKANVWKTSSAYLTVPVRANVTGVYIHPDGSTKPINHVYDYYGFTGDLDLTDSPTVFETPAGVICKGRQKTLPVPDLPRQFYYRQEVASGGIVTYYDVWYDADYKYLRYDYRPYRQEAPFFSTNPVTEVLDYNTGVHYHMDNVLGNCTILPLEKTSFGAKLRSTNRTGSFVLDIQNPLDLFYLDKNFTFVGRRPCREMVCDVYSAVRKNLVIGGHIDPVNTTIEIFILSDGDSSIIPEKGQGTPAVAPIMMTISADTSGFILAETFHFFDFDNDAPDLALFDVSTCYNDMSRLEFNVRFTGVVPADRHKAIKELAQVRFAQTMGIEITRLQNFRVDLDYADVIIHARLLDKLPAAVQFNYAGNMEVVDEGDQYIGRVNNPQMCAEYCIQSTNFTCNSFDYCPQDADRTCRLNHQHISDGLMTKTSGMCNHFSRTADGPGKPDLSILEAYEALRLAVYRKQLQLQLELDDQQMVYFLAVDTNIEFGSAKQVPFPKISKMFTYNQEIIIPSLAQVFESKVWYNSNYKLVRYDFKNSKPEAPYYSTNPMTMIHDFNTGVQYVIDKFYQNCTISPITNGQFDAEVNQTQYLKTHQYVINMKNPLELFHADTRIKYVGQKTIRNLLCDVFLGAINDFYMPGLNGTHPTIIKYYFLTGGWSEYGSSDDSTNNFIPVKIDLTIVDTGTFITYNYYDFEMDQPDGASATHIFNIQKCYTDTQQHRFQITFPGTFEPYLDLYQRMFLIEAASVVAQSAGVYPLRLQEARIDHDEDKIYFTATLLDKPPFLSEFTKIPGKVMPHKTDGYYMDISSAYDCAEACVKTQSFPCNSFDICPSVHYCFLSKTHVSQGVLLNNGTICDHYSRSENVSVAPTPSLYDAFINLKNDIYSQIIHVNIPTNNGSVKVYEASTIRDTLVQFPNDLTGGKPLQSFSLYRNNVIYKHNDETLPGMAIDDCAVACLRSELFDCQSFEYCPATEMCYLSKVQPSNNSTFVVPSDTCNLYNRQYLNRYEKLPGVSFTTPGYKTIDNISSDDQCAKLCTQDLACKSFDFCNNINSCQLRKTHKLDMPKSTMIDSPTCDHYSRKYIDDFSITLGKNMMIESSQEILGVTADQCAKMCIEQEASTCLSFIFCGNQTVCQLKNLRPRQTPIVASQYCDLYTRQFFPGEPPVTPPPHGCNGSSLSTSTLHQNTIPVTSSKPTSSSSQQLTVKKPTPAPSSKQVTITIKQTTSTVNRITVPTKSHTSNHPPNTRRQSMTGNTSVCTPQKVIQTKNNPGTLAGVAVGVFILGALVGGLISHFIFKKYTTRSDDMNMNLIRDR